MHDDIPAEGPFTLKKEGFQADGQCEELIPVCLESLMAACHHIFESPKFEQAFTYTTTYMWKNSPSPPLPPTPTGFFPHLSFFEKFKDSKTSAFTRYKYSTVYEFLLCIHACGEYAVPSTQYTISGVWQFFAPVQSQKQYTAYRFYVYTVDSA